MKITSAWQTLKKKEPFSANTIIDIGSVSKQFTALCIALLEEDQQLSIEDDIRKYFPEFPAFAEPVKITHLIHMSSGIKDYEALVQMKNRHYFDDFMTNQFVVDLAVKQQSLNFEPGCQYEYSNTNYILLAEIVERISGKSLQEFAKENIFGPLGMESTFFNENQGDDFKNRAFGYMPAPGGFESPVYRSHLVGDGGIFTTLSDMVKWDLNFLDNKLGKGDPSLNERMKQIEPFCDGTTGYYAFAQVYTMLPYGNSWSHGGGGGGYRTFYERFEEDQISFIALSNSDNSDAFGKVIQSARLFLEKNTGGNQNPPESSSEKEAITSYPVNEEMIDNLEGFYYDSMAVKMVKIDYDSSEQLFNIVTVDEYEDVFSAVLKDPTTLIQKNNNNTVFSLDSKGVLMHTSGSRTLGKYKRQIPTKNELSDYAGKYFSEELSHEVELLVETGQLVADNNYMKHLTVVARDFLVDLDSGATLSFKRNEVDQVSSFAVNLRNGDRLARDLFFRKKE